MTFLFRFCGLVDSLGLHIRPTRIVACGEILPTGRLFYRNYIPLLPSDSSLIHFSGMYIYPPTIPVPLPYSFDLLYLVTYLPPFRFFYLL